MKSVDRPIGEVFKLFLVSKLSDTIKLVKVYMIPFQSKLNISKKSRIVKIFKAFYFTYKKCTR